MRFESALVQGEREGMKIHSDASKHSGILWQQAGPQGIAQTGRGGGGGNDSGSSATQVFSTESGSHARRSRASVPHESAGKSLGAVACIAAHKKGYRDVRPLSGGLTQNKINGA